MHWVCLWSVTPQTESPAPPSCLECYPPYYHSGHHGLFHRRLCTTVGRCSPARWGAHHDWSGMAWSGTSPGLHPSVYRYYIFPLDNRRVHNLTSLFRLSISDWRNDEGGYLRNRHVVCPMGWSGYVGTSWKCTTTRFYSLNGLYQCQRAVAMAAWSDGHNPKNSRYGIRFPVKLDTPGYRIDCRHPDHLSRLAPFHNFECATIHGTRLFDALFPPFIFRYHRSYSSHFRSYTSEDAHGILAPFNLCSSTLLTCPFAPLYGLVMGSLLVGYFADSRGMDPHHCPCTGWFFGSIFIL